MPEPPGMRMSETSTCGCVVVERRQHVARVGEAADREVLARQRLLEHEADRLVVVDDPDGFHAAM